MSTLCEAASFGSDPDLMRAADTAVKTSLRVQPGEKVLIITNPRREVLEIASAIYDSAISAGARATLILQPVKTQMDDAEELVLASFEGQPDVVVSLSAERLGKDAEGIRTPYEWDGVSYDHVFNYQLHGAKTLRAFWSPNISREMFKKTVPIDYAELQERCRRIKAVLDKAVSLRVTNATGTDLMLGLQGRQSRSDDGDYSAPGSGGNLPAGEVFVSPALASATGVIAFDGSIADSVGDIVIRTPIRCRVERGFVVAIEGGEEARRLERAIELGAEGARGLGAEGSLTAEKAAEYERNARAIGEFGIGLNPKAEIVGRMLEDEKAFGTCHFAIGANYDEDGPALIHLDGLVSRPTIVATMQDGKEKAIEREGELVL
ncbi:MAG TPA: aminopeptidase [Rectinemataceae bacterium]|nr:aminopeptidase [Rectinemataceae bacterium]